MRELYSASDLSALNRQMNRRLWGVCGGALVLTALALWSLNARIEPLTVGLTVLVGALLIFGLEMLYRPLYSYRKLLLSALHGRHHEVQVTFDHAEGEPSVVDGVVFRSLIFLGEPDKHGSRDQLYYWDREKELPAFEPGRDYLLRYTGKTIIGWQPVCA